MSVGLGTRLVRHHVPCKRSSGGASTRETFQACALRQTTFDGGYIIYHSCALRFAPIVIMNTVVDPGFSKGGSPKCQNVRWGGGGHHLDTVYGSSSTFVLIAAAKRGAGKEWFHGNHRTTSKSTTEKAFNIKLLYLMEVLVNVLFLLTGDAVVFPSLCYDYSARRDGCHHPSGVFVSPGFEIQFRALGEEPLLISYEFIRWINHIPVQLNSTLEREGPLYVRTYTMVC